MGPSDPSNFLKVVVSSRHMGEESDWGPFRSCRRFGQNLPAGWCTFSVSWRIWLGWLLWAMLTPFLLEVVPALDQPWNWPVYHRHQCDISILSALMCCENVANHGHCVWNCLCQFLMYFLPWNILVAIPLHIPLGLIDLVGAVCRTIVTWLLGTLWSCFQSAGKMPLLMSHWVLSCCAV